MGRRKHLRGSTIPVSCRIYADEKAILITRFGSIRKALEELAFKVKEKMNHNETPPVYVQQVGRAIRPKSENNETVHINFPYFKDIEEKYSEPIDSKKLILVDSVESTPELIKRDFEDTERMW